MARTTFRMRPRGRILFLAFLALASAGCRLFEIPTATVYLTNNATDPIVGFYYGDATEDEWSGNLLENPVEPETTRIIEGIPKRVLDVKIVIGDANASTNISQRDFSYVEGMNISVSSPA